MLCEKCQQQPANVFFTMIVDGEMTKRNLCESCTTEGFPGTAPHFTQFPQGEVTEEMRKVLEYAFVRDFVPPIGPGVDHPIWEHLAASDERFSAEAYQFVAHAVSVALAASTPSPAQHVSGRDVAEAFRTLALSKFGTSALTTLNGWSIRSTDDIGTIVFRMIEFGILGSRPEDTLDDFHAIYEFAAVFPTDA